MASQSQFARVLLFALLLSAWPAASTLSAAEPPEHGNWILRRLFKTAEIRRGLCVMPFEIDGTNAIDVAVETKLLVHASVSSEEKLRAAQSELQTYRVLGKRVYVERADGSRFAFADNSVDVVMVSDAASISAALAVTERASNTENTLRKVRRVLRPAGVLLIHGSARQLAAAEKSVRDAWKTDGGNTTRFSDSGVQWLIARKPEPQGLSDWPYWYGDAGNNLHSDDEVIGESHMTQ